MEGEALRRLLAFGLAALAVVWGALLVVGAFTAPAYRHHEPNRRSYTTTLVQENGNWIVVPTAVPALVALVVGLMLYRRYRLGSANAGLVAWLGIGVLFAFAVVTLTTIGLYVLPIAVFLSGSALLIRRLGARSAL